MVGGACPVPSLLRGRAGAHMLDGALDVDLGRGGRLQVLGSVGQHDERLREIEVLVAQRGRSDPLQVAVGRGAHARIEVDAVFRGVGDALEMRETSSPLRTSS